MKTRWLHMIFRRRNYESIVEVVHRGIHLTQCEFRIFHLEGWFLNVFGKCSNLVYEHLKEIRSRINRLEMNIVSV